MSDLHGQIINIKTTSAQIGTAVETSMEYNNDLESRLALAYKMGHRDARHAAAELSIPVQAQRDKLLEAAKGVVFYGPTTNTNMMVLRAAITETEGSEK